MQSKNSPINRKMLQGAALLLAASVLPVQAQPATAAELFVGAVLVAGTPVQGTAAAERWDGRDSAGASFVRNVLLPRTVAATASSDDAPQGEAAALFVDTVLRPRR
jgi:hypothetical protein